MIEKEYECKIKVLSMKNGSEYMSKYFDVFSKIQGIIIEASTPYILHQNRVAQRKNDTIIEIAKNMLHI